MKKQYVGDKNIILALLGSFWVRSYTIMTKLCKSNPKTQPLLTCIFAYFVKRWIHFWCVNSLSLNPDFSITTQPMTKPFCTRWVYSKWFIIMKEQPNLSEN